MSLIFCCHWLHLHYGVLGATATVITQSLLRRTCSCVAINWDESFFPDTGRWNPRGGTVASPKTWKPIFSRHCRALNGNCNSLLVDCASFSWFSPWFPPLITTNGDPGNKDAAIASIILLFVQLLPTASTWNSNVFRFQGQFATAQSNWSVVNDWRFTEFPE